jgi:hypothetical protein
LYVCLRLCVFTVKSIDDCCLAGWACIERKTLLRDDRRYIYLRKEIDKEIYSRNILSPCVFISNSMNHDSRERERDGEREIKTISLPGEPL